MSVPGSFLNAGMLPCMPVGECAPACPAQHFISMAVHSKIVGSHVLAGWAPLSISESFRKPS